jgi:hypothetical protein
MWNYEIFMGYLRFLKRKNKMGDIFSSASLLLAIITVLYSLWNSEIMSIINEPTPSHWADRKRPYRIAKIAFKTKLLPLAISIYLFVLIFLPDLIRTCILSGKLYLIEGIKAVTNYSSANTAFVTMLLFSFFLAYHITLLLRELAKKIRELDPTQLEMKNINK